MPQMAHPLQSRLRLVVGDITRLDADAVVTAANEALRGGGGVDGAVHGAAGPELVKASRALAPCPAGEARITPGFKLQANFVIHAVGPIYQGRPDDAERLSSAYRSSLALAGENNISRIAFPCISTGVYGYPKDEACQIAIDSVLKWLEENERPEVVTFCCFADEDAAQYRGRFDELGIAPSD